MQILLCFLCYCPNKKMLSTQQKFPKNRKIGCKKKVEI